MSQNIDDFNRAAALVFARLYSTFPKPLHLRVVDLDPGDDLFPDEKPARLAERRDTLAHAVIFLADEGFIRYADARLSGPDSQFADVRLTSKGLATLNKTPATVRPAGKSLGDLFIDLGQGSIKATSMEAAKEAVRLIFTS